MGKTAMSGPVYGAKALLWTAGPAAAASTNADTNASFAQPGYGRIVVPPGEDWYVTGARVVCSTVSTVAAAAQWKLKVEGGSTTVFRPSNDASTNAATILTIASGGSSNLEKFSAAAITPGEYEGTYCPTGSTVRWCSSYADAPTTPQMSVFGYIRFLNSTVRGEQMSAWDDYGNPAINSTAVPVAAPSTATLLAELDSTQLGTKDLVVGQKKLVAVKWILGCDTNVTWQCGVATSTVLSAGRDEFYAKTPSYNSAEFVSEHELFKDERLRARLFSTGANAAAYITAKVKT